MPILTNISSNTISVLGGGVPVPQPALGAELITNGDMSSATGWTLGAAWGIAGGIATATNGSGSTLRQLVLTPGTWYLAQYDLLTATSGTFNLYVGTAIIGKTAAGTYYHVNRAATNFAGIGAESAANGTVDNVSYKAITLASMFSARPYSTHVTVKAQCTITAGTRAGVVCNLDSATNPQNFIIASHDGTTVRLTKCVGGTYTELISTAVTYVAGAFVEIRRIQDTNYFELWYNNSLVSTAQLISDASIISNTLCGYFNSFAGNNLYNFSCVPNVTQPSQPVPVLGTERVTNGDFESGAPPSNWTAQNSATLASDNTETRPGSSGTKCISVTRDAGQACVTQGSITVANTWYFISGWARRDTASGAIIALSSMSLLVTSTSWTNIVGVLRATGVASVFLNIDSAQGHIAKFDDVTIKPITLASMFSTRAYGTHQAVRASLGIVAGTVAGVVTNLDSPTTPANFIYASHDGTTCKLVKCVAGTYTELISATTTYVVGAEIEIRRQQNTDYYTLFYNGNQIGAVQSISGLNGVYHGMMNTYSGNLLLNFACSVGPDLVVSQPVPVLGTELLTNTGFSADANWTKGANWAIADGVGVGTAVSNTDLSQVAITNGAWLLYSGTVVTITNGNVFYVNGGTSAGFKATTGQYLWVIFSGSTTYRLRAAGPFSGTVDDLSCKPITLASMFGLRPVGTHLTVKAQATIVAGTRAGVVCNADSATSPANFIIASHDGTTARLTKCVAGTYTELVSQTVAYSAGAYVEIRRTQGTNFFELYYNNALVGTAVEIADAGIISNTLAGLFNTYSSNVLASFSCVAGPDSLLTGATPTLGAEVLSNGNFETGDPPTGWTKVGTSATIARVSDQRTGGSGQYAMEIATSSADVGYGQINTVTANTWYFASCWLKRTAGAGSATCGISSVTNFGSTANATWTEIVGVHRSESTSWNLKAFSPSTNTTLRADDYTVRPITLASTFSVRPYGTHRTTKANATVIGTTRAGVVANLDNPTTPANFVFATHNGITVRLTKCVAGVYTDVVSNSQGHVPGAPIEIRRTQGTDFYELYYNNALVGTAVEITGMTGVYHGTFNTYSGNTIDTFSCVAGPAT